MVHDYSTGIENKKDIIGYDRMTAKEIFKVDIETGEVLVDRLDKLNDRFGVMGDETKED